MSIRTPVLDTRNSEDIYNQALLLARRYCPEMKIPKDMDYFDPDDPGLVIFKLFSKMMEYSISQFNKIPDKHRLSFLDFVGIDLLPARPSSVPLTFYLSEGSKKAFVPAGTRIASSKDPDVIFETESALSVVQSEFGGVFSLNPWEDGYTDHSTVISGRKEGFGIFGKDAQEMQIDHVLYIGDDTFLNINRPASLTLHITGTGLTSEYFKKWFVMGNDPFINLIIEPKIEPVTKLDVTLNIRKIEKSSINSIESYWISVMPGKKIIKGEVLPTISDISADLAIEGIIPEMVVSGNAPVDVKKGFYPFGEQPEIGNVLYIGSDEAFSKGEATITLNFEIDYLKPEPLQNAKIKLEYWNGIWISLGQAINFGQGKNSFTFTCPAIPQADINGVSKRWLRARIEAGGFGIQGKLKQVPIDSLMDLLSASIEINQSQKDKVKKTFEDNKITTGFSYNETNFNPPFVKSLNISYEYKDHKPGRIIKYNNFKYENTVISNLEEPFKISTEKPGMYLGFNNNPANMPLALFFAVKEILYNEPNEVINEPVVVKDIIEVSSFTWKYHDGNEWNEFGVTDETYSFTRGGIVSFIVPSNIVKRLEFNRELYWIKVEIKDGNTLSCPKLYGIYPNTVWALNNVTVKDEILGGGTGLPNLTLFFSKNSILEGQIIEVKEAGIPSKDELRIIESENGKDALRVITESGETKEVWIQWMEVHDFALSGTLSRHYIIDRVNGKITFGDGERGMVPPKDKNNIVARIFKSGGGIKGEVDTGIIISMKKTIPNIEKVVNHIPSSGGMDQETSDSAVKRGPYTLKNGNRAVTKEDFEWLAKESSQYIAKSKCILESGKILVIIVPAYEEEAPLPEAGLLDLAETYIKERAYVTILDRIEVVGPEYVAVDLVVTVKPVSIGESNIIIDRILERLGTFLHPLKGGPRGEGWDFGQDIFISKIAAAIEDVDGVDYVKEIKPDKQIKIKQNALPCAGRIDVKIEG